MNAPTDLKPTTSATRVESAPTPAPGPTPERAEQARTTPPGGEAPRDTPAAPAPAALETPSETPAPDTTAPDTTARETAAPASPARPPVAPPRNRSRRRALMLALPVALILGGGYFWLTGGRYESTEDANLHQAVLAVSAGIGGRVTAVPVINNQHVKKGEILFRVDPHPYQIALDQANAALVGARIQVGQLRAAYAQAQTRAKSAADDVNFYQTEYNRQKSLSAKGVASASALENASWDLQKAVEGKLSADQAVKSALAALGGDASIATDAHPLVLAALAAREKAAYDLSLATVRAPADGIVYNAESFKTGQYVSPGAPLFSLVETGDTWVTANFKETELTNVKPGQSATVTFDTYPGHSFAATVQAIGAGTGAEFSLLPAQNATGNWVKVTQRIPVRLKLSGPAPSVVLRSGMSATVTVDTGVVRSLAGLLGGKVAGS